MDELTHRDALDLLRIALFFLTFFGGTAAAITGFVFWRWRRSGRRLYWSLLVVGSGFLGMVVGFIVLAGSVR